LLGRVIAESDGRAGNGAEETPMRAEARDGETEVVLLAYRPPEHETGGKAIEFSSASIEERWQRGREDMVAAVETLRAGRATRRDPGYTFYDCRRAG
jgi:hypothetical protein